MKEINIDANDILIQRHGKEIKLIAFPDSDTEKGAFIKSTESIRLIMVSIFHGEYDEYWIIELQKNKKNEWYEYARYNPKYVDCVVWKEEAP